MNIDLCSSSKPNPCVRLETLSKVDQPFYLALRFRAFRDELKWTRDITEVQEIADRHDLTACSLGLKVNGELVGAIRLTLSDALRNLPAGKYAPDEDSHLPCAEISKGVVASGYRHCGILSALIAAGIHLSTRQGARKLLAAVVHNSKGPPLLRSFGFVSLREQFPYSDEVMTVLPSASLFALAISHEEFDEPASRIAMENRLQGIAECLGRLHGTESI